MASNRGIKQLNQYLDSLVQLSKEQILAELRRIDNIPVFILLNFELGDHCFWIVSGIQDKQWDLLMNNLQRLITDNTELKSLCLKVENFKPDDSGRIILRIGEKSLGDYEIICSLERDSL